MIRVELPGPPRGKGRPRFSRETGRAYTDAKTQSYEGALRLAAAAVMGRAAPLEGPLTAEITAYMPIAESWSKKKQAAARAGALRPTGKPDFDNLAKTVDALNGIVWRDDALVVDCRIQKFYSDRPALVVEIHEIGESDAGVFG